MTDSVCRYVWLFHPNGAYFVFGARQKVTKGAIHEESHTYKNINVRRNGSDDDATSVPCVCGGRYFRNL